MLVMKHCIVFACLLAASHAVQAQDPTETLVEQLKSKKAEPRIEALVALADLGPKAHAAIPALVNLLPGIDDEERILATMALAKIGKASLPAVEKLLAHEDETTRYYAVWTLGLIGKDAHAYPPRLLGMFEKDADEEVRVKTIFALARIAPESKDVFGAFAKYIVKPDAPAAERLAIIDELRHFGPDALEPLANIKPGILESMKARESLADLVAKNKNDAFAKRLLPHLPRMLIQGDPFGDPSADDGMSYFLTKHGEKLLPILQAQLQDKNPETSLDAIKALGSFATNLVTHVENPELVKKINTMLLPKFKATDAKTRLAIASSVPYTDETAAAFEALAIDDDANVRLHAFGRVQTVRNDFLEILQQRMKKADPKLQIACAVYSLSADTNASEILWAGLADKDAAVRHRVACALMAHQLEPEKADKIKKEVLPILVASLKSDNIETRLQTAQIMVMSAGILRDHVPALLDRLDDPSREVRVHLLNALQTHANADAKQGLQKLTPFLKDDSEDVRLAAIAALASIGKASVPHLAPLVHQDKSMQVRETLCARLGVMKETASDAIPSLLLAAQTPECRHAAIHAVSSISPEKSFPDIWAVICKHDDKMKAIAYPKNTHASSELLCGAIIKDWPNADRARRVELAYALQTLIPLMPASKLSKSMKSVATLIDRQLQANEKDMKSKQAKVRLDALATLGGMKLLNASLYGALFGPESVKLNEKQIQQLSDAFQQRSDKINNLIRLARSDAELEVRRAARKADAAGDMQNYPFGPSPFGPFNPFNPFGPGGGFPGIRPPGFIPIP